MKHILLALFVSLYSFTASAQVKLLARSTYNHDGTSFYLQDTTKFYYAPANATNCGQNLMDAWVKEICDSSYYYFRNSTTLAMDLYNISKLQYNGAYTQNTTSQYYYFTNNLPDFYVEMTNYWTGALLDSQFSYQTSNTTSITIDYGKYFYHYNTNNLLDTAWSVYFNASGAFYQMNKTSTSYYPNNLTDEITVWESTDSLTYTLKTKQKYYYNTNGLADSIIGYVWSAGIWNKLTKKVYTYNTNQMKIKDEMFYFNAGTQAYIPSTRDEYLRTDGIHIDSNYSQLWNSGNLVYDTTVKGGFIYTGDYLTHRYGYQRNTTTQSWEPQTYNGYVRYYYSPIPTGASETLAAEEKLMIYPNPAAHWLQCKQVKAFSPYRILTPEGRLISQGQVNAQQQIDVQHLTPGLYVLSIDQKGKTISEVFSKL
ncbi:MAG: T9SS type A sorting domain-containing protein [Chitinophagaceae bacterium]|nr:T9SS type A sorting domain-containing protein [Chitinophagaceae bacterium]